jgi:hypothetical protein
MSAPRAQPGAQRELRAFEMLHEHAELELELAGRGDIEALGELSARWEELTTALPQTPPADAAPLLEHSRLMHERTRVELLRLREALVAELDTTRRARRMAEGYAGGMAPRPRLDRSA